MESIGVRELRTSLAATLRRAGAGERILITLDGAPIAQVGPIEPTAEPTLADLVAAGLITAPRRPNDRQPDVDPIDLPVDVRLDDVLNDLRGQG